VPRLTATGWFIVLCAVGLQPGCGDEALPTKPTPPACTAPAAATPPGTGAALAVLVMSRGAPLGCAKVRLEPIAPGATGNPLESTTGSDGRAVWRVVPNQRYSVHVRDRLAISAALLEGDVQWLVSLPD
jgi:hypothetical protein